LAAAGVHLKRPFVGPTVDQVGAQEAREAGVLFATEEALGHVVAVVLLRLEVFAAVIAGEVDPKARDLAREGAVPGGAVPEDGRAGRDLDRDYVLIPAVAVQPDLVLGRLAGV